MKHWLLIIQFLSILHINKGWEGSLAFKQKEWTLSMPEVLFPLKRIALYVLSHNDTHALPHHHQTPFKHHTNSPSRPSNPRNRRLDPFPDQPPRPRHRHWPMPRLHLHHRRRTGAIWQDTPPPQCKSTLGPIQICPTAQALVSSPIPAQKGLSADS